VRPVVQSVGVGVAAGTGPGADGRVRHREASADRRAQAGAVSPSCHGPESRMTVDPSSWILTSAGAVAMVAASTLGIWLAMVILTRVGGLRSFSKLSSFDFAVTVAIGSVIASTIVAETPPLLQATAALAALYAVQMTAAVLRRRSSVVRRLLDNEPLLVMRDGRVIEANLDRSRMTRADLRAKLREANVLALEEVRAVVVESTGDVSVLHGPADGPPLSASLLEGVRDPTSVRSASGDGAGPGPPTA